ncbi:hypothetical protein MUP01_12880 [Candidatus Bathyarchaeota archaeon]|nr:hypothetical protein [Candidatus Bathyarchaeota archaeon]
MQKFRESRKVALTGKERELSIEILTTLWIRDRLETSFGFWDRMNELDVIVEKMRKITIITKITEGSEKVEYKFGVSSEMDDFLLSLMFEAHFQYCKHSCFALISNFNSLPNLLKIADCPDTCKGKQLYNDFHLALHKVKGNFE